jgi:hypothetical protein
MNGLPQCQPKVVPPAFGIAIGKWAAWFGTAPCGSGNRFRIHPCHEQGLRMTQAPLQQQRSQRSNPPPALRHQQPLSLHRELDRPHQQSSVPLTWSPPAARFRRRDGTRHRDRGTDRSELRLAAQSLLHRSSGGAPTPSSQNGTPSRIGAVVSRRCVRERRIYSALIFRFQEDRLDEALRDIAPGLPGL